MAELYAQNGFAVFPMHGVMQYGEHMACTCGRPSCQSPAKHPIVRDWQGAASTDRKEAKARWKRWPWANIGIATGAKSRVFVLDIDPRSGGEDSIDDMQVKYGKLPDTATAITGGGGRHLYFRHPGWPVRNSAGAIAHGIDVRGDGGAVVAPGSLHISGRKYEWEASSSPRQSGISVAPQWLLDMLSVAASRQYEIDASKAVVEGGRNVYLTSLAGAIRRYGCSRAVIETALLAANAERCDPPLEADEVKAIAKSVARYAPAEKIGRVA